MSNQGRPSVDAGATRLGRSGRLGASDMDPPWANLEAAGLAREAGSCHEAVLSGPGIG
jgi:hypothetical protein